MIKYQTKAIQSAAVFCPECGGAVMNKSTGFNHLVIIYAGVLNNPNLYTPTLDFYTDSAQNWSCMLSDTKKFPKQISKNG
ncbi:GFA family protein [Piscirickettsia litoralis]|uniref:GFA family protein n=1 Tax=Piscirickettsia litoralis TaxID=1891921 RepID=UPI0009808C5F|nr:GFA family protein [Piscirickettsia litoralis]